MLCGASAGRRKPSLRSVSALAWKCSPSCTKWPIWRVSLPFSTTCRYRSSPALSPPVVLAGASGMTETPAASIAGPESGAASVAAVAAAGASSALARQSVARKRLLDRLSIDRNLQESAVAELRRGLLQRPAHGGAGQHVAEQPVRKGDWLAAGKLQTGIAELRVPGPRVADHERESVAVALQGPGQCGRRILRTDRLD